MYARASYANVTFFFSNHPPAAEIYTLCLHDALPIWAATRRRSQRSDLRRRHARAHRIAKQLAGPCALGHRDAESPSRSEEHTSELQSRENLVCRLLLEKIKK